MRVSVREQRAWAFLHELHSFRHPRQYACLKVAHLCGSRQWIPRQQLSRTHPSLQLASSAFLCQSLRASRPRLVGVDKSAVDSWPGRLYTEYRNCGTGFTTERARWYRLRVHSTSSSSRLPGWSCWARPPAAAKLSDGGPSCGMAHARPNREKESASAPRVDTEPAPAAHGQFSASCDMGRRVTREPCVQVAETCAQDHVLERAGNIPHACAFGHGGELRRR